jgi:hypothetical protein
MYMRALKYPHRLKEIKMTQDYADYIVAQVPKIELHKLELHNCPSGCISTFEGVPIIVDNTLDIPYKLVFDMERKDKNVTNCLNCGAPFDIDKEKCAYCGTSYYDMSALDINSNKPFMLKIKTTLNGQECYITQLVRVMPSMDIEITSESVDYVGAYGNIIGSVVSSQSCLTNLTFQAVQRQNGEIMTISV